MTERQRVFMLGATGTIGRATVRALVARGHEVVCFVRPEVAEARSEQSAEWLRASGATVREGHVVDATSLARDGICGERFDAVISCMASRTGAPRDAWAIDYQAHVNVLTAVKHAGIPKMVFLSAMCVQKPLLAFQHAKLAFENELIASGLTYSIVRPTAFFKSLSGQVERVRKGKPYLVFGDGNLTACKPIGDDDLAHFLVDCLHDRSLQNRVLPIGGPGDALTPRQQADQLFGLLGQETRIRKVPVMLIDVVIYVLSVLGKLSPFMARKAELARIGRYYATESMLVWNSGRQSYDASATPSTGTDTLVRYQARLLRGDAFDDRGAHAVF